MLLNFLNRAIKYYTKQNKQEFRHLGISSHKTKPDSFIFTKSSFLLSTHRLLSIHNGSRRIDNAKLLLRSQAFYAVRRKLDWNFRFGNPHYKYHCPHISCFFPSRTGYIKHLANYKSPVQNAPTIRVGQPGADAIDLSEKVVVVTGA